MVRSHSIFHGTYTLKGVILRDDESAEVLHVSQPLVGRICGRKENVVVATHETLDVPEYVEAKLMTLLC